MATNPHEIKLDEDEQKMLANPADAVGKPWRQLLREAIVRYVPPQQSNITGESALDVALRLGLVGCATDLPPDLSTNPEYLEGFGETSGD